MRICIIGIGYVGLPTAACFSEYGNIVKCYDNDLNKVENLNNLNIPFFEPNLKTIVKKNMFENRLKFTFSLQEAVSDAEIIFICVGTPQQDSGEPNLTYLWNCIENLKIEVCNEVVLVIKSTVPVGTTDKVDEFLNGSISSDKKLFAVTFCPEFLKQGCAVNDTLSPDRIIIGCDNLKAADTLKKLYDPFTKNHSRTILMPNRDAELTKYAANAMLATRISFMNEFSHICECLGADIENIRKGIGSDPRIGHSFLYAGLGYGGSCFPKDISALLILAQKFGINCDLLSSVKKRNNYQREHFCTKIINTFDKKIEGLNFICWGVAFKPETDDLREAPSLYIIQKLLDLGANLFIYDPVASENLTKYFSSDYFDKRRIVIINSMYENLIMMDALLLLTEWKQFRSPDFSLMKEHFSGKYIFDGRNQLDPGMLNDLGIIYFGMGR